MSAPLVSVVIPAYNAERSIDGALESVDLAARQRRLADDGHAWGLASARLEHGEDRLGASHVAGEDHGYSPLCWRSLATMPVHPVW